MHLAANDARVAAAGPFRAVETVSLPDTAAFGMRLAALARAARRLGCEWLFHTPPLETPSASALDRAALASLHYDIIFGALATGAQPALWRPSRLAFDEASRLPHALLNWWIGRTVLARTDTVWRLAEAGHLDDADEIATLFALWGHARAVKLAQPLSDRQDEPEPLRAEDRAAVLARLQREPVRLPVDWGDRQYLLPYTGRNAGIEREQTRGLFFEADELMWLRRRLGPGRVIADIGANTGNHTIFFAGPMQAARVIPFEPLPDAAAMLSHAVAWNRLANVDLSMLHHGVGARPAAMRAERSERGGLGATRLVEDVGGDIKVLPLDALLTGPVDFLKIDVEAMEMDVLSGARGVIARNRPAIFIEVAEATADAFRIWLGENDYGVERVFSDKGHTNLLVLPRAA
ncbi:FkbM family methyltransferase [Aureimonas altamirensis]|uniref:FkbM family methyltransferase n=1 Tax=Aureimonas altamirensis TaxID=370622 RepID=UPI002036B941|nr:FkbM family methyltransferase [Aureimonas altamirensis]MCM2502750.1 FkbM family methyltransferase [Aureimonas altamirensis]